MICEPSDNHKSKTHKDTQKIKRKESKHNTKETYWEKSKRRRKDQRTTKTTRKYEQNDSKGILISNYFKCKWTKCSKKRHRVTI